MEPQLVVSLSLQLLAVEEPLLEVLLVLGLQHQGQPPHILNRPALHDLHHVLPALCVVPEDAHRHPFVGLGFRVNRAPRVELPVLPELLN